jgi:membrane-bound serine protease (ClpP class)
METMLASPDWVSAGGIALILIGISFLILEAFLPAFGLFGFAGAAAILIGVVQLHQTGYIDDIPVHPEILIGLAVLLLLLALAGGIYTFKLYRKRETTGIEGMVGDTGRVLNWQGKTGRVFVQGENWEAYSDENHDLKKDDEVFISKVENLKIRIIPKKTEGI